jgi:hypothetical protein
MATDSEMGSTAVAAERRSGQRQRVLKGATLSFNGGYGAFECVIRDQSAGGARLMLGDAAGVPAHFDLHLKGETPRRAKVRWRGGNAIGVSFE